MDSLTQDAVLLLLGLVTLQTAWGDTYLRYVKAGLQPFLFAAGGLLVALALVNLLRTGRRPGAPGSAPLDDGHGHGSAGPSSAWLLLMPVLVLAFVAPPALGSYTAARSVSAPPPPKAPEYEFAALKTGSDGVSPLGLPEYASRAEHRGGQSLEGATVRLTGFVTPIEGQADAFWLTRIYLNCCAADGRAVKVRVEGAGTSPAADSWLQVEGAHLPSAAGASITTPPRLAATLVRQIPAPAQPYG